MLSGCSAHSPCVCVRVCVCSVGHCGPIYMKTAIFCTLLLAGYSAGGEEADFRLIILPAVTQIRSLKLLLWLLVQKLIFNTGIYMYHVQNTEIINGTIARGALSHH